MHQRHPRKIIHEYFGIVQKTPTFAVQKQKGRLADRLGNGLQNRAERFDSATDLQNALEQSARFFIVAVQENP